MNTIPNLSYEKICPIGNHPFKANRTNQVYCGLKHQKFKNNIKAKVKRDVTKQVNAILLRNREILEIQYKTTKTINFEQMKAYGYKYDYHTQAWKHENQTVYSVYDYILVPIGNNSYKIQKEEFNAKVDI